MTLLEFSVYYGLPCFLLFCVLWTSYQNHKEVIKEQTSFKNGIGMLFKGIFALKGELKSKRVSRSVFSQAEYDEITKRLAPIFEEKRRLGF